MASLLANDVLETFELVLSDGKGRPVLVNKRRDGSLSFLSAAGFPVISADSALYKLLEALQAKPS